MADMHYTKDHEWIIVDGDIATVGITDFAQSQLGDVVFVELPAVGAAFAKGDQAAVVESVKAAAEIYAPLSGDVTEANPVLDSTPELVNADPESGAWFFKLRIADASEFDDMMDEAAYKAFLEAEG